MSTDTIQEIIEILNYAKSNKDWNSVDEALEILTDEETNSEFDDNF
jgi:hypothetical protein